MKINQIIREKRKALSLTQEQVAGYLGVSAPAVHKWEKGSSCPDISLLPALARLLKTDLNELFSFREELTEWEIDVFVRQLTDRGMDGDVEGAFPWPKRRSGNTLTAICCFTKRHLSSMEY